MSIPAKTVYKTTNWHEYNRALKQRGSGAPMNTNDHDGLPLIASPHGRTKVDKRCKTGGARTKAATLEGTQDRGSGDYVHRPSSLNHKEKVLVLAYLEHGNASRAAREAGFSARSSHELGRRLLRKVEVRAFIEAMGAEMSERLEITAEQVLAELGALAFSNMFDVLKRDDAGRLTIDISRVTRGQLAGIAELHMETVLESVGVDPDGKGVRRWVRKLHIKMHPKLPALEKLGRHLFGMFRDNPANDFSWGTLSQEIMERSHASAASKPSAADDALNNIAHSTPRHGSEASAARRGFGLNVGNSVPADVNRRAIRGLAHFACN